MNDCRVTRVAGAATIILLESSAQSRACARGASRIVRQASEGRTRMRIRWRLGIAAVAAVVLATTPQWSAGGQSECERKAAQRVTHDCVSCDASVSCLERVTAAGGAAEIIPIGHGLMVIYNTPV